MRQTRGKSKSKRNLDNELEMGVTQERFYTTKVAVQPLKPKTENQKKYINAISSSILTFGTGPAGTGKTYIAGALAAQAIQDKEITKIIITRPAVEAGEELGFLPGEVMEKYMPYLIPFLAVLNERLGKSKVEYMLKTGQLEAAPLAYMRGITFSNAYVILDEAQNTTPTQMKMFLTRIGENCKVIVNGDIDQKDIRGESGLSDAIKRVSWIPSVKIVTFDKNDIVRSGLVQDIVSSYSGA